VESIAMIIASQPPGSFRVRSLQFWDASICTIFVLLLKFAYSEGWIRPSSNDYLV
jgi:hypothetical protein